MPRPHFGGTPGSPRPFPTPPTEGVQANRSRTACYAARRDRRPSQAPRRAARRRQPACGAFRGRACAGASRRARERARGCSRARERPQGRVLHAPRAARPERAHHHGRRHDRAIERRPGAAQRALSAPLSQRLQARKVAVLTLPVRRRPQRRAGGGLGLHRPHALPREGARRRGPLEVTRAGHARGARRRDGRAPAIAGSAHTRGTADARTSRSRRSCRA